MSTAPFPSPASTGTTNSETLGTGRRKTSVARVRIKAGTGKITINDRPVDEYFGVEQQRQAVLAPLIHTGKKDSIDCQIKVHGGGIAGQAGAIKLGIARALKKYETGLDVALRQTGLLTRDGRMKERKKYGLRGARRGTQFSKR
jgi:small subunit ribosomal protein S9